jgi:hypothetical protein
LAGETEVLGENLSQRHFFYHKSHSLHPVLNPGRSGGKPATNRLSYGAAGYYFLPEVLDYFVFQYSKEG